MKTCNNCGNQVDDFVKFCTYCGATLQSTDGNLNNQTMNYDNTGYQNPGYENSGYQNPGYQTPGYENTGYQNQGYSNQGYPNPGYPGQGYPSQGYQNVPQPIKKARKPLDKKTIAIIAAACGVVVIALAVYFIFFAGKLTKGKAEKLMEEYIETIEDKDVKGLINKTVPKALIKDVLKDMSREYDEDLDYDEVMEELDDGLDYYEDELDELEIKFSKVKVGKIERFELKSYINRMEKSIEEMTGEELDVEEYIEVATDGEMTMDDIEEKLTDILDDYNIDIKEVYIVDCSFEVSLEYEGDEMEFDSDEIFSDHLIVYMYDGEWYIIPSAVVEGAVAPAMVRYIDKSAKASDVSSAKTIKTAVETALTNERAYEEMTCEHYDEMIYVTKSGLEVLSPELADEIMNNLDDEIPEIKYTGNGAEKFAFTVSSGGTVRVYTVDDSGYYWELAPDLDWEYD